MKHLPWMLLGDLHSPPSTKIDWPVYLCMIILLKMNFNNFSCFNVVCFPSTVCMCVCVAIAAMQSRASPSWQWSNAAIKQNQKLLFSLF